MINPSVSLLYKSRNLVKHKTHFTQHIFPVSTSFFLKDKKLLILVLKELKRQTSQKTETTQKV